jgi:hypothetical protein
MIFMDVYDTDQPDKTQKTAPPVRRLLFSNGQPCGHPGCGQSIEFPCPVCRRIRMVGDVFERSDSSKGEK